MKIGFIGLPHSGKTTVFNALTGLDAGSGSSSGRGKTNLGVVKVPDARVDALAELYQPKKTTYAEVTFSDIAGGDSFGGRDLDRALLPPLREADALCLVARAFESELTVEEPNPMREIHDVEAEMLLADLELIERRLDRLKKEKGKGREEGLLVQMKEHLDKEAPLRSLDLGEEAWALFSGYRFLTLKPLLLVLNVNESQVAAPPPAEIADYAEEAGLGLVVLSAKVEQDIAQIDPEEQQEFVASLGLSEPASGRFLRAAFALLDLISMLTSGEDECRAWPIRRGTVAQKAAGKIHSDIERGFIKAEVIWWEDLITLGSEAACRSAGKMAIHGKEYVVRDGDVINFRFNV